MKGNIEEIRETLEGYFREKHPEIEVAYTHQTTSGKEERNEFSSSYPYRLK